MWTDKSAQPPVSHGILKNNEKQAKVTTNRSGTDNFLLRRIRKLPAMGFCQNKQFTQVALTGSGRTVYLSWMAAHGYSTDRQPCSSSASLIIPRCRRP